MPHPAILSCLYLILGLSVFVAWWGEFRQRQKTHQDEGFWPGTTSAPWAVHALVISGVLFLTLLETASEVYFGVSQSQSTLPSYAIAALLGASFIEEIQRGQITRRDGNWFARLRSDSPIRPQDNGGQNQHRLFISRFTLVIFCALQSAQHRAFAIALFYGTYRA